MPPTLTLIIITHNSAAWLPGLLHSWQTAVGQIPHEILIADSGSTDTTRTLAATLAPTATILDCGNIGFGAAANRAAALATSPWLLLCNPDLQFPANFAETFLLPMTTSPPANAGCIAPNLVNADLTPQHSVGPFPTILQIFRDQVRPRPERKYTTRSTDTHFDWATGACLLVRRDHFQAAAGFDEQFFLYVEEVDLQKRLAKLGLCTYLQRNVALRHLSPHAARPNPGVLRYSARGTLRYFAKHGSPCQLLTYRLLTLLSGRLPPKEALAPKQKILATRTGP